MTSDDARHAVGVSRGRVGSREFDSPALLRVATDRQSRSMTNWNSETHSSVTVSRTGEGNIQYIKVRAEYFEVKETTEGLEDEYGEGVHSTFKFDVVGGDTAVLEEVKDISDGASSGYTTTMDFVRAIPIAEQAVLQVPDVKEVQNSWGGFEEEYGRGADAI